MEAPWIKSFEIEGDDGIGLAQINRREFLFTRSIRYIGQETGLEAKLRPEAIEMARLVTPERMPITDLVSVPTALRWFVGRYGVHTPAALIHDWLIPSPSDPPVEGMTDALADRYFRFMLKDLGVRLLRRWMMWTAVAMRTRFKSGWFNTILLLVWLAASLIGITTFIFAVLSLFDVALPAWATEAIDAVGGEWAMMVIAALAPFAFAVLWGRQYGAGVVAAYTAVWVTPPTVLATIGYLIYLAVELILRPFDDQGDEPYRYKYF